MDNVARELLRMAKQLVSIDFPTRGAMEKYLREHPDADKSNHRVVEKTREQVDKEIEEEKKQMGDKFKPREKETPDEVEERLKKQMGDDYKPQEQRTDDAKKRKSASGNAALEWARNLAVNYRRNSGGIRSQILDAVRDLGLDERAVDKRWQRVQDMDLRTKEGMYFLLTGTRFPGAAGYTWASTARELLAVARDLTAAAGDLCFYVQGDDELYIVNSKGQIARPAMGRESYSSGWIFKGVSFHNLRSGIDVAFDPRTDPEQYVGGYVWDLDHGTTRRWGRKIIRAWRDTAEDVSRREWNRRNPRDPFEGSDRTPGRKAAFPIRMLEKAPDFDAAFRDFMDYCQKVSDEYMEKEFPTLDRPVFEAMEGGRYIRVVRTSGSGRSAHLFVDKTNGDILKTAGWSAPAKHPRGNIFDKSTWKNVGPYGAAYLR